ncbi:winged helix-turn-helix domain-containing protein [Shewanella abyssi]|uniref:winged helix-turn-helix domain-containing protein n=1 Tax=Shewanella abyssi TaxID=311789 RepID=UPI00200C4553|nr:winged helix-turn-helix domain-containing protein [Shewanella abyssi]MCL1049207.1 winged helix-turn-helix domain-containing protein [Shewanella abyssi]
MNYYFSNYKFNSTNLCLYKDKVSIQIRSNEARLLSLLLSSTGEIVSKTKILDTVWSGKVVSEQAVFQNISSLRVIFGEHAIKTFSGKGYQWQLTAQTETASKNVKCGDLRQVNTTFRKRQAVVAVLGGIFISLLVSLFIINNVEHLDNEQLGVDIKLLPFSLESDSQSAVVINDELAFQLKSILSSSRYIEVTLAAVDVLFMDYTNTPDQYFSQLVGKGNTTLVLSSNISKRGEAYFLRYELHGISDKWSGEFQSPSIEGVLQQLAIHLERVASTPSLLVNDKRHDVNHLELELLHRRFPADVIIFERFIVSLQNSGNLNKALILAEKLKSLTRNDLLHHARAELLLGNILVEQGLSDSAELHLSAAQSLSAQLGHFQLQSDIAKSLSLVGRNRQNYHAISKYLRRAMYFARKAEDPVRELSALNYLYIFNYKLGNKTKALSLLEEAELILYGSGLPQVHYSQIYLHKAISADNVNDKEQYSRELLALYSPKQENWLVSSAQTLLVELLIEQQRWQEANSLFIDHDSFTITESYLVATILLAQERMSQAAIYAAQSFEKSTMAGDQLASLNAALLLFTVHSEMGNQLEQARYRKYISDKSTKLWAEINRDALSQAGLSNRITF